MTFTLNLVGGEDFSDQLFNQTIDGKTVQVGGEHSTGQWSYGHACPSKGG
jgi:hypothetical protein